MKGLAQTGTVTRQEAETLTVRALLLGQYPAPEDREYLAREFVWKFDGRKPNSSDIKRTLARWDALMGVKPPEPPDTVRTVRCCDCYFCPERANTRCNIGQKQSAGNMHWRSCENYRWAGEVAEHVKTEPPPEPEPPKPPPPAPKPPPPTLAELQQRLAEADLLRFVADLCDTEAGRLLRLMPGTPDAERMMVYALVGGVREHVALLGNPPPPTQHRPMRAPDNGGEPVPNTEVNAA